MRCSPMQVLETPDWMVWRAIFHSNAKSQGLSDKYENEQKVNEVMDKAFGH